MKIHCRKKLKLLLIVGITGICILSGWRTLFAQSTKTKTYTYESTSLMDAYSNSLGMGGVSLAYRPSSMYANPATLPFLVHPMSLTIDHYYDSFNAVQFENLSSIIYNSNSQSIAVGLTFRNSGYGSIEKKLGFYSSTPPSYRFKQFGLAVGYSLKVTTSLSFGALLQANNGMVNRSSVQGKNQKRVGSLSLGLMYSPTPGIEYGVALRGLGRTMAYTSDNNVTMISTVELHQALAAGITLRYPYTPLENHPYMTLSVSNEKVFGRSGMWYKIGAEVLPVKMIGIRIGYAGSPEFKGMTVGLGLNFNAFSLSYALAPGPNTSGRFQQLSLSLNLSAL